MTARAKTKKLRPATGRAKRTAVLHVKKGLSVAQAGVQAGYSESYAKAGLYKSIKRPQIQSIFTDAADAELRDRKKTIRQVIAPYFDALDAPLIVKSTQLGDAYMPTNPETQQPFPDHATRMSAADRIVDLYGGKPNRMEMPSEGNKALVVIISRDGSGTDKTKILDVTGRTTIEPQGQANPKPLGVKITREP